MSQTSKSRTREDIRKRNRDIIDKANAELRSETKAAQPVTRFRLTKSINSLPQISSSFDFATGLPPIELGPIRCDHSLDAEAFANFDASSILLESLRESWLSREDTILMVDMVNIALGDKAAALSSGAISAGDAKLLTDDTPSFAQRDVDQGYSLNHADLKRSRTDTAHFLRRPQMMTSEASTAFNYGADMKNSGQGIEATSEMIDTQFAASREISVCASTGQYSMHPVLKRRLRIKRCLQLLPFADSNCETVQQVKFDENPESATRSHDRTGNHSILTKISGSDSNEALYSYYSKDSSPMQYTLLRQYLQSMDWSARANDSREEFFVVSIPAVERSDIAFIGAVGKKMLLKKALQPSSADQIELALESP